MRGGMHVSTYTNDGKYLVFISQDGKIYEVSSGRKGQYVGIDKQLEDELRTQISEMQEVLDSYYSKLVELGEIIPPKSPDEIAREAAEAQVQMMQTQLAEQSEINRALLDAVRGLTSKVEALEGKDTHDEKEPASSRTKAVKGASKT